jgi:hypothetical protein
MLRKNLFILMSACALAFALSACGDKGATEQATSEEVVETVSVPPAGAEPAAWKKYLAAVVMQNMQGVKTTRPYMYFVPAGTDGKAEVDRSNQLDNVAITVSRGVLPGNMLAFGGPDSATTADLIIDAFSEAGAGTFQDVTVLFVGASADSERVKAALDARKAG